MSDIDSTKKQTKTVMNEDEDDDDEDEKDILLYHKINPNVLKINYSNFFFSFNGEYVIEGLNPSNHCFYYYPWTYIPTASAASDDDDNSNMITIWKKHRLPKNNVGRCCHTCIFHENFVYLIGGYNGNQSIASVERYDFVTKTWDEMQPMIERRTSCDSILCIDKLKKDTFIFVLGGIQNGRPLQSVLKYNIRLNTWEKHGSILVGRSGCKCFYIEERNEILIIGGAGSNSVTNKSMNIEVYNIQKRQSRFVEQQFSYSSFGSCIRRVKGKHYIYLSGGGRNENIHDQFKNPGNQCFLYIVEDDKMIELPQMISNRMYHSMVISNNDDDDEEDDGQMMIYVFGGVDENNKILPKAECFDGKEWKVIDFLTHPYCASTVFKLDDFSTEIRGSFKSLQYETYRLVEGPVEIKTKHKNEYFQVNGTISKNGYRNGLFSCKYEQEIDMHPIIYDENCVRSNYENYILEKKIEQIMMSNKSLEFPKKFCCPITRSIYIDPVVLSSGNSYERQTILKWLETSCTDPLTRENVESQVYSNRYLQCEIKEYIESVLSIDCDDQDC